MRYHVKITQAPYAEDTLQPMKVVQAANPEAAALAAADLYYAEDYDGDLKPGYTVSVREVLDDGSESLLGTVWAIETDTRPRFTAVPKT